MRVTELINAALIVGTRIYYTGDVCNPDGWGEITYERPATRFADKSVDVRMDDGREMRGLWLEMFHPQSGQRFYLATDWKAKRAAAEEEMRRYYANYLEKH